MTLRRRPTPIWFWPASCWPACRCRSCGTRRPAGRTRWCCAASASSAGFGGVGHYCLVRAFELPPAPFVSPFNYAQILGAAVLSSAVFGQAPDLWTWIGSAVIVFSGVFIVLYERLRAQSRRKRPG